MAREIACSNCGTANPAGAKFCAKCGRPLQPAPPVEEAKTPSAQNVCPQCGYQNVAGARFCLSCGYALVIEEEKRRFRWWIWLLVFLGLIIGGTAVAVFVWPGVDVLVSLASEEQPTAVVDQVDDTEDIPTEETDPAQEEETPEELLTTTATADDTADIPGTVEAAVDELPIATLPPPLANVEIPVEPVVYPDDWTVDLRFPEQFSVVETESGPMPGDASAGWAAKYRFDGDPENAADLLTSFLEANGWQIVEEEKLDAGGVVMLIETEDGLQSGIIVFDPDPNQAGHSILLATILYQSGD